MAESGNGFILPEIVSPDFLAHWAETLDNDEYHSDKTAVSSTVLKLFDKSAASVLCYYMTRDEGEDEPEHFRLGRAIHVASLEPKKFIEFVVQQPEFKGTGSRREKAEWTAAQKKESIILSQKEFLQIEGMVNSVLQYPDAVALMNHGVPEISGYYRDKETGIKCKIRPDLWDEKNEVLLDVKSCVDCSPYAFSKRIYEYKYHLSMAMYAEGIYQITGKRPETWVFLAIEKKPPYECAIYICKEKMMKKGYEDYNFSMQKLKLCLETNQWPRRQDGMEELDLPEYVYKKELDIYE